MSLPENLIPRLIELLENIPGESGRAFVLAVQSTSDQVKEQANRIKLLEKAMADGMRTEEGGKRGLQYAQARHLIPEKWSGSTPERTFADLMDEIKAYFSALDEDAPDLIDEAANQEKEFLEKDIDTEMYPNGRLIGRELARVLRKVVYGPARTMVVNTGLNEGLAAWHKLTRACNPRSAADGVVSVSRITHPKPVKDARELKLAMEVWQKDLREHETKFESLPETVKISGLKALLPYSLFERIKGETYKTSRDLIHFIDRYLGDKQTTDIAAEQAQRQKTHTAKDLEQLCGSLAQNQENEEIGDRKIEEMLQSAVLAVLGKGGGKGWRGAEGGGKGGKGERKGGKENMGGAQQTERLARRECWTCGSWWHLARDCPKGKGKGGKAGGKGGWYGKGGRELANVEHCDDEIHWPAHYFPEEDEAEAMSYLGKGCGEIIDEDKTKEQGDTEDEGPWMMITREKKDKASMRVNRRAVCQRKIDDNEPMKIHIPVDVMASSQDDELCLGYLVDSGAKLSPQSGEDLMALKSNRGGWIRVGMTIDSGAADNVIPRGWLTHIPVHPCKESKAGKFWRAANGESIQCEGEKVVVFLTDEGYARKVRFLVADVNKALISAKRIAEAGNEVRIKKDQACIKQGSSQEHSKLHMANGVYALNAWIKVPNFHRQG